ncbi:MFS transporter [Gordonia sp. CPCC 206044]|uniref:MFS transporter n=1 Tax=Gordonia sp. CPCC 206044 TaxID=3140793 RepID=UPI003AF3EBC3
MAALNVAVPAMSSDLEGGVGAASWVVVGFLLANSATILLFSKLSDELGRRWFYLGGVLTFVLLSLVCALTSDDRVLIIARVLQGLAAASAVSNSTAVISDVFVPERLPFALSLHIAISGAATLVGPVIGGYLVDAFGWRSIFWAMIPVGVAACCVGWVGLRNVHAPPLRRFRVDIGGVSTSVLGIGLLLCGTTQFEDSGHSGAGLLLLGGGAILLVLFVICERHVGDPILDLRVVTGGRGPMYAAAFCASFSFGGVAVAVALYLQMVKGLNAGDAGVLLLPMGFAMLAASSVTGLLQRWLTARMLNVFGASVIGVSLLGLAVSFHVDSDAAWICAALVVAGIGEGLFMASITSRVMAGVPAHRRAVANGFRSTLHNGALAASAALVIATISSTVGNDGGGEANVAADSRLGFVTAAAVLGLCGLAGAALAARGSHSTDDR